MGITSSAQKEIRSKFDAAAADANKGLPGVIGVAIGKDGNELFSYAAGKRGTGCSEDMTVDNALWIASCTKMIKGYRLHAASRARNVVTG